jgi:signal transduction histidine kinase
MRTGEEMAQPVQTTTRRSAGAVVLAIPLLAVLVLAGLGAAGSLRAGARAERVRGLVPYTGALTNLVHELQRERSLSADASAGPTLEGARRTVDGAAANYRDAAVRVEISDRDRRLHQRLDTGLAQLAGLTALRASVDSPAGTDQAATVFRRYTEIVGGLLAVNAEIGLSEAGQDAGLVRAVTAATAFSRAKELADREREAAAQAASGRRLDQAERTRLAFLGGRQDALLDQFAALASREQLARYARAFSTEEIEEATRLRRAALEGGSGEAGSAQGGSGQGAGPDLAGWTDAAAVRVERMRTVELGLTAETARLAGLGDRAADRRALAYAATFLLAASALVVLLVLAPGRARRAKEARAARRTREAAAARMAQEAGRPRESRWARRAREAAPDPATEHAATRKPRRSLPSPPEGERSRTAKGAASVVHSPLADPAHAADPAYAADPAHAVGPGLRPDPPLVVEPGLADLARRSQDLVDQQLELLDQAGRDQGDPKLPGRLLQVDRLAARARRNAHNLIVLAGGEPARHWDGPAPLAEVAALAVRDNPDASRVDLDVAGELLVAGPAAEDLANLLAELVDNATAFSAPETRVRVGGQEVGSGYVLEVEDRGLGMTDGELEAVNRRLSGDPAAGDDLEQRLGTWVAGRLARRHDVRVQLRRSPYGGVTALVFLPDLLVVAAEPVAPAGPGGPPPAAGEGGDAALASLPLRRYVTQVPEADPPLPKRAPHASLAPDLAAGDPGDPATRAAARSPEQVRSMLTRYRSGLERGRAAAARDLPEDPDGKPTAP